MRPTLHADISRRLLTDYGFKPNGAWLQEGTCPDCGKKELYAKADSPWILRCGRINKCGAEIAVKDQYRDLFETWSDRYHVTETNPHAAADAYLQYARGFDLKRLQGLYAQEHYHNRELNQGSATVRFTLACGSWWERLIDRPERFGKRKANFAYGKPYNGHWWQLPDSPAEAGELWLTEGVFDTIALELNGVASRALLSCNNYPEAALTQLREARKAAGLDPPVLVWALDGDAGGRNYTRKWIERARAEGWDCKAAQIAQRGPNKSDWNDLHLRQKLGDKDREEYLYEGALLIAESAIAKALLMYKRRERSTFHFGYDNRLFWFSYDDKAYQKAREALEAKDTGLCEADIRDQALLESGSVSELANCYPSALYYQANALTDESWYYYRVAFPHKGKPIKNTFTAAQLSSASEFKKRLLSIAPGAVFTGGTHQLDRIFKDTLFSIKTVETINFIGYAKEHGCYVLGDLAVKDGAVHALNDEDYFDIGKLSIKSLNHSLGLSINRDRNDYRTDWVEMIWRCYGAKGLVALTYWFGSLFAEHIRATEQSFPFLEMSGDPGTGKTTLIDFLWKLVGRTGHEGMDPSKSSLAGRTRHFTQVANLPVVLIESDRDEESAKLKRFDWEEIKPLYNGHIGRSLGVKNSGNDTYDPPFRASIVIEQNAPVTASNAILERIVHMTFDKALHNAANKEVADRLSALDVASVSGFILAATRREKAVMETVAAKSKEYARSLMALPDMKNARLAKNHGQMMALVDALRTVVTLTEDQVDATHQLLMTMALDRQQAINADHPYVQAFWEVFEHLDSNLDKESINHSRNPERIAISLVDMEARMAKAGVRLPVDMTEIKKYLRTSRARRFIANETVNSCITNASKKCWVFQKER